MRHRIELTLRDLDQIFSHWLITKDNFTPKGIKGIKHSVIRTEWDKEDEVPKNFHTYVLEYEYNER